MERLKASDYLATQSLKAPDFLKAPVPRNIQVSSTLGLAEIAKRLQADAEELTETINCWKRDSLVLNQLCEVLSDAVIRVDSQGFIFDFNEAACKMFNTTPAYILGKNVNSLLYTDWQKFSDHYEPPAFEHMVYRTDGTSLIVSTALTHVANGEHILVMRDITQRVKSEQDIRILSAALNQASDVIVISNSANKIIFVNQSFVEHTGYSAEEAIGQNPGFLKSGLTDQSVYKSLWETLKNKRTWEGYLINKRKDGTVVRDFMIVTAVMNGDPVIPAFYIAVKRKEWSKKYEESSCGDSAA